ncbi:MAG: hypothetical protein ACRC8D_15570, partial [Aeromonas sp.]
GAGMKGDIVQKAVDNGSHGKTQRLQRSVHCEQDHGQNLCPRTGFVKKIRSRITFQQPETDAVLSDAEWGAHEKSDVFLRWSRMLRPSLLLA